jgi:hypothetical protein
MSLSIADVKRLVNSALDGDVADQTTLLVCFSFSELSEQDKLIIGRMAIEIASKFRKISVLTALELIFKLERFIGMSEGRYETTKTYLETTRLTLPQIEMKKILRQDEEMFILNDF